MVTVVWSPLVTVGSEIEHAQVLDESSILSFTGLPDSPPVTVT
jgi:hypothetical protein